MCASYFSISPRTTEVLSKLHLVMLAHMAVALACVVLRARRLPVLLSDMALPSNMRRLCDDVYEYVISTGYLQMLAVLFFLLVCYLQWCLTLK